MEKFFEKLVRANFHFGRMCRCNFTDIKTQSIL